MTSQPELAVARSFWQRFKGLMLSKPLPLGHALLIERCTSVHTFFMRYALDLAYLDQHGTVVKLVCQVKPWRMSWGGRGAAHILELTAGGVARHGVEVGDVVTLSQTGEKQHATQAA